MPARQLLVKVSKFFLILALPCFYLSPGREIFLFSEWNVFCRGRICSRFCREHKAFLYLGPFSLPIFPSDFSIF